MEIVDSATQVVVLGKRGSKRLDVGTAEEVLTHITGHMKQQGPAANGRLLRFFGASGEVLALGLLADWRTLVLVYTGDSMPADELQAEVQAVFDVDPQGMEDAAGNQQVLADLPPTGSWDHQVDVLSDLFASQAMVGQANRGSWAHNFFVHGWL